MTLSPRSVLPSPVPLFRSSRHEPVNLRLARDRAFVKVRHGVYAPAQEWLALAPWQRYLARVHAYALINTDAIFSHESAAALTGLPVFGEPRSIHVFSPDRSRSLRFGDVSVHTSQDARDFVAVEGGGALTTPADTVVDLARVLPPAFALAVVDAALRDLPLSALIGRAATQSSNAGRSKLEWLWERADVRAESAGESVSRAVIEWCGLEQPELQMRFTHEGHRDRCDFYWLRTRTVGESDGYGKYHSPDPEETKRRLLAEKKREDRLRRHEGGFVRWDWGDALRVKPLHDKLRAAGIVQIRPASRALLATLRQHPRSTPTSPGAVSPPFAAAETSTRRRNGA